MNDQQSFLTQHTDESVSTIHHALRATRRRLTVMLVSHRTISSSSTTSEAANIHSESKTGETTVSVRQLAREIVSLEENISIQQATGDPYHNVYTALIQTHLPQLADVSAIEYDHHRKTVRPGPNLVALAMVTTVTSPVAQMLFHNAVADLYSGGSTLPEDAITD